MSARALIRLSAVSKGFLSGGQMQPVLQSVDLQLHQGEIAVLLGPSGCGKSTLLSLIAGLEWPDSGTVELLGKPFSTLSDARQTRIRRRSLGIIFQFFNLVPTLTVAENLHLPQQLNGNAYEPQRIDKLLQSLGVLHTRDHFPEQLSGGEQQRVAIARALIHQPAIVLADEPTGSLDEASAEVVNELLFDQARQQGSALLLVTHNPALARRADRVLQLHQGRLVPQRRLDADDNGAT